MRVSRRYAAAVTRGPTSSDVALAPALPYPDGWFAIAFSDEVGPGEVVTRPLMGEDVVLYRIREGAVRAVRPYCPHLGAHLGLGRVEGDELVCRFHGFAFDRHGTCVRTGYGSEPPKAPVAQHHVREVNGAVFVWRHHDDRAPDWEIPTWHVLGRLPARHAVWEMAGHAQDLLENSVDFGHFSALHGWDSVEVIDPVVYEGTRFRARLRMRDRFPLIGTQEVELDGEAYGLGCIHADVRAPRVGIETCVTAMATMIAPGRFQFRQTSRLEVAAPTGLPPALGRLIGRGLARVLDVPMFRWGCAVTAQDFPIWEHKCHVSPPRLAHGDGPIGSFRQWTRQFYPPIAHPEDGPLPRS